MTENLRNSYNASKDQGRRHDDVTWAEAIGWAGLMAVVVGLVLHILQGAA